MLSIKGGSPCRCKGRSKAGGCKCKKSQTSRKQSRRSASRRKSPKRKSPRRARSSSKPRGRVAQTVANAVANEIQKVAAAESASPGQLPAAAQKAMATAASEAVKDAAVSAATSFPSPSAPPAQTAFPTPSAPPADLPAVSQQAAQQAAAASVGDAIREAVGTQPQGINVTAAAAKAANAASSAAATAVATATSVAAAPVEAAVSAVPLPRAASPRTQKISLGLLGLAATGVLGTRLYQQGVINELQIPEFNAYGREYIARISSGEQYIMPSQMSQAVAQLPTRLVQALSRAREMSYSVPSNYYTSLQRTSRSAMRRLSQTQQQIGRNIAEFVYPTTGFEYTGPVESALSYNVTE